MQKKLSKITTFFKNTGIFVSWVIGYLLLRIICEKILDLDFFWRICIDNNLKNNYPLYDFFYGNASNLCIWLFEYIPSIILPSGILIAISYLLRKKSKWFMYSSLIILLIVIITSFYITRNYSLFLCNLKYGQCF